MSRDFAIVAVSATSPTWSSPVTIHTTFEAEHVTLYDKSGTAVVEYSHDGVTLDGELDPTDGTRGVALDEYKASAIYFRIKAGSTGPANVYFKAWSGNAT